MHHAHCSHTATPIIHLTSPPTPPHLFPPSFPLPRCSSDLAKLHLPYRLTTRAELNALKAAGHLSIQAPSSMLMRVDDAVKLMREKGMDRVRKLLSKRMRALSSTPHTTSSREAKRNRKRQQGLSHSAPTSPVSHSSEPDSTFLLPQPSSDDSPNCSTAQPTSDAKPTATGEEAEGSEGEEEEEEDGSDDDDSFSVSEVTVLSSYQFRVMWQQSMRQCTSISSSPSAPPPPAPLPRPPSCSPAGPLPLLSTPTAVLRKGRKSPSPFSLSYHLAREWSDQLQQRERREEPHTRHRQSLSEGEEEDVVRDGAWRRKRVRRA